MVRRTYFIGRWPEYVHHIRSKEPVIARDYCSVVILGCGVNALQNSRIACFGRILQEVDLEKRKTGRKRPRLLKNRRKLGQIDEKNARNLKKALPGRAKTAPGSSFQDFGSNCEISPSEPGKLSRKVCQNSPFFAIVCKNLQKSPKIGKKRRKHPIVICTYPTLV